MKANRGLWQDMADGKIVMPADDAPVEAAEEKGGEMGGLGGDRIEEEEEEEEESDGTGGEDDEPGLIDPKKSA
jgi:hypothetical protein